MRNEDRHLIDPDGVYSSEGLRGFERRALEVIGWRRPHILARTRDAIEVRLPDPRSDDGDLVVIVTPEAVELRLSTIDWTCGSYGPARSSSLWQRVTWTEVGDKPLAEWLDALRGAHKARLATCIHCQNEFIQARMTGNACHGCAERVEGVCF